MRASLLIALLPAMVLPAVAASAPVVQSVADSATYGPRVAPGSLATIFGANLAGGEVSASGFPLPNSLGGVSISIGDVLAPLLYVSAGQINFQVPSSLTGGNSTLVVNGPGGTSAAFTFTVTASAPAIFQYGTNHALAQNAGGTLNGDSAAAPAGSVVTVYLTGTGNLDNPVADGLPAPLSPLSRATATATATIGPMDAPVQFLGLTPGFAGLAQANIQVPALPNGDYPLVLTVGGYVSASAVISVSGAGTPYVSPLQISGSAVFANSATSSVALYNNVAYVCGAGRIVMVDVTDPTQPGVIGEFGDSVLNGNGIRCAINATVANPYLVEIAGPMSAESFAVYGLSNPRAPNLLGVVTTPYGHMVDLSFAGNFAFITTSYITYFTNTSAIASQNGDLLVFDFTNPALPQFVTTLQRNSQPGSGNLNLKPFAEVVDGIYEYVASSTATGSGTAGTGVLNVVSIATPSLPVVLSQTSVAPAAILLSFDVSGTTLLAAGNTAGQRNPGVPDFDFTGNLTLTTMDVSNPQTPVVLTNLTSSLQVNGTFHVFGFSDGVFAIVNNPPDTDDFGPSSLMIADARQPNGIALLPFQTQFGLNGILTTTNGYLFATTSQGLTIYQRKI